MKGVKFLQISDTIQYGVPPQSHLQGQIRDSLTLLTFQGGVADEGPFYAHTT